MSYTIIYEQEADNAESPLDAARWTLEGIDDREAMYFTIIDNTTGKKYSVDLSADDQDAVVEIKDI